MINWQAEVERRKEDMLADLMTLLSIPSVRDDAQATAEEPVGPGPKAALNQFLAFGERDGFVTKSVGNLAGHIAYGSGDECVGIFGHVDVVPPGTGWDTDPFEPVIKEGRIYARGASDDKGPSIAAYYAMKIIKDLDLPLQKEIKFIIGTDEESGWQCMDCYLASEPMPDLGFSPDAEFPIINGEKGNATYTVTGPLNQEDAPYTLCSFTSGLRPNMVPEEARAVIQTHKDHSYEDIEAAFQMFIANEPVTGTLEKVDEHTVAVTIRGKAAHAQEPRGGYNAATYLAKFLMLAEFSPEVQDFLQFLGQQLHEQSRGEGLDLEFTDDVMGDLTVNPGMISADQKQAEHKVTLNFRYPKGTDDQAILTQLSSVVPNHWTVTCDDAQEPHYVSPEDPLVQTLLDVYEKHTGLPGSEKVIGGGTFGRLLKRGVAYGAMFPDSIDTMHQANEFFALDDFYRAAAIYAEAIYELAK